ncbi:hypothetical protein IV203_012318 [Nitzschia inconspicua]|uniref:Uncharacterized protein n=1 Tax=Nitzschia inconspicua TaxID=303405 RepID=A0A9K3PK43_9STRA|nr:hypothetical protein IV203_012318 [Nitzschia inconspicua]
MEFPISTPILGLGLFLFFGAEISEAFSLRPYGPQSNRLQYDQRNGPHVRPNRVSSQIFIIAPPGSGYFRPEDEVSELPDSYEPMMEYPGTMRPGRTPENMPFHDLPIGDDEPDPVPWPHFQQISWHHRWDPPHPHPVPMEDFIEQQGRWATPEQEAEMRSTTRKASRKRREVAEEKKREDQPLIMDDDEDDELDLFPQDLGEGIFGKLGSTDDEKITAEATSPDARKDVNLDEEEDDYEDESGLDDFLLDLGLDSLGDEEEEEDDDDNFEDDEIPVARAPSAKPTIKQGLEDVVTSSDEDDDVIVEESNMDPDITASIDVDEDDDLDLGLDDEDELEDSMEVPLEDFGDSDNLDMDDFFDDGGFDYDDGDFDDVYIILLANCEITISIINVTPRS